MGSDVHAQCNSVRAAREQNNVLGESVRRSLTCRTAPRLRQRLDETRQMSRRAVPLDGTHTFAVEIIEGEIVISVVRLSCAHLVRSGASQGQSHKACAFAAQIQAT
jgi:hypothetical protein